MRLVKETINIVFVIAVIVAMVFGYRALSNVATPVTVHKPVPGVTCATMVTGDGAAISCWKDDLRQDKGGSGEQ